MPLEVLAERLKKFLVFVLLFLLAACAAFCLLAARQGHFSSVPAFRAYVLRFGALGPVVLTAVQAIQVILPVLPGFLGCAVGAGLFGAAGGFVDYLCWLSGLSGYPSRRFFWIIVLGKPWCILAYSLAFARLF